MKKNNNSYFTKYGKTILSIIIIGGLLSVGFTINWF